MYPSRHYGSVMGIVIYAKNRGNLDVTTYHLAVTTGSLDLFSSRFLVKFVKLPTYNSFCLRKQRNPEEGGGTLTSCQTV